MRPSGYSSIAPLILQLGVSVLLLQLISVFPQLAGAQDLISPNHLAERNDHATESPVATSLGNDDSTGTDGGNSTGVSSVQADAQDFWLRIMPLGASITKGEGSNTQNGYRRWLRKQLRWNKWKVNMVGTQDSGGNGFADTQHEGHPGKTVKEVHDKWNKAKGLKPNLVLINAGSNDCNIDSRALNAKDDMESLIKAIFDDVPGVSVVLSTLAPSDKIETCAEAVSQQYRDLVPKFTKGKIALADFYSGMDQKTMMHPNDLHPNDVGYKFMASIWWDAITKIQGNFKAPLDNGTPDEAPDDSIEDPGLPTYPSRKSRSMGVAKPFQA